MTTTLIVLAIIVVVGAIAWLYFRRERSKKLRNQFGPEYEQAVRTYGTSPKAEDALLARQKRIQKMQIRSLTPEERDRFAKEWHDLQAQFVDDPSATIEKADRMVCQVMQARGYLMADFEVRAEDLSVDHPVVVSNYRAAHAIALRRDRGEATTEDLRKALVYYRDLFDELLEVHVVRSGDVTEPLAYVGNGRQDR